MKNNLSNLATLHPGDVIVAKKRTGFWRILDHYIVYVGNSVFIGNLTSGVKILPHSELKELMKKYEPVRVRRFQGTVQQRHAALKRAYSRLGQQYGGLSFNCEHFANWVQTGKEKSDQVTNGFLLLTSVVVLKMMWADEE